MRTILLNRHKTIPSNCKPNTSKVYVHTCLLEEVRIKGFGATKVPTLEQGVGFPFTIVSQVEVGCIIVIHLHFLGLWFSLFFGVLFLLLFIVYHARAWCQFGSITEA
jgi:hypothetical protein